MQLFHLCLIISCSCPTVQASQAVPWVALGHGH
uniref:Truncated precore/core protein n=1 Tax=Hepatitis B virus TaxID=10407 RepID=A0A1B1ACD2_HBV|nr:truncated precore/core protein [Hepatitis B virus]